MTVFPSGVSEHLVKLCQSPDTIASELARNPTSTVHSVWKARWPKPFVLKRFVNRWTVKHDLWHGRGDPTTEDLDRAEQCGKFPYRPSDLFLKIFSDVLLCLERDPLSGVCSPSLMGSSAVMPLSIISVIPDIMKHYYDCIVRAEKEVILATNYWQNSNSNRTISNALRELSKRAAVRGQTRLPVKIMWDRGTFSQLVENHAPVNQEIREGLELPQLKDIPNLHIEVINYHRPMMGTFHAKFLIVDRKIAMLNSNNIQDRPNLEMMIHLEGPVVESFYDVFLYSWHTQLRPMLPCLSETPQWGKTQHDYLFREANPYLEDIQLVKAAKAAREMLKRQRGDDEELEKLRKLHPTTGGGRLQAFLGGLGESRRGSFADERVHGTHSPPRQNKESSVKFSDIVTRAMESRRKSFAGPSMSRPRDEGSVASPAGNAVTASEPTSAVQPHPVESRRRQSLSEASSYRLRRSFSNPGQTEADRFEQMTNSDARYTEHLRAAQKSVEHLPNSVQETEIGSENASRDATVPSLSFTTATPAHSSPNTPIEAATTAIGNENIIHTNGYMDGKPEISNATHTDRISAAHPAAAATKEQGSGGATNAKRIPMHMPTNGTHADGNSQPLPSPGGRSINKQTSSLSKKGFKPGLTAGRPRSNSTKSNKSSTGPPTAHTPRQRALSTALNAGALSEAWAAVDDTDVLDEFNPHTLHHAHDPFPIAMVNRKPHGLPGHQDIRVPQDAAWLAGFRYAQKSVFIQTPTFNAKPVVRAALQACRRGIQVTIWADLGFNDKGESMPFQGGTNEQVVERMYKDLRRTNHQKNLHVYWYIGKDQVRPLNAVKKQRNCHVKFMQIDDAVGIQGNGNQDTQSWYHSCEINVMVDSREIVREWMEALHRQQNTQLYGRLDDDGIWRDKATGLTAAQLEDREEAKRLQRLAEEDQGKANAPLPNGHLAQDDEGAKARDFAEPSKVALVAAST